MYSKYIWTLIEIEAIFIVQKFKSKVGSKFATL